MSALKKDQLPAVSQFMTLFWKEIVKPYYNPEQTESWWDYFINDLSRFGDTYCLEDKRLMKILLGFYEGVQEVYRSEKVV